MSIKPEKSKPNMLNQGQCQGHNEKAENKYNETPSLTPNAMRCKHDAGKGELCS